MKIYVMFILILNIPRIHSNPYCVQEMMCGKDVENGFCTLFRRAFYTPIPEELEGWPMTDEVRTLVVQLLNKNRNLIAHGRKGKLENSTCANMQIINYDMELEYLAYVKARMPQKGWGINTECLKTRHLYVNYIEKSHYVESASKMMQDGLKDTYAASMTDWAHIDKNVENFSSFDEHQKLFYHATLDYVGCYTSIWQHKFTDDPYKIQLDTVCMFGSSDSELIPVAALPKDIKKGQACSRCPDFKPCNKKFKSLCGFIEKFEEGCHRRWNYKFWSSPDLKSRAEPPGCLENNKCLSFFLMYLIIINFVIYFDSFIVFFTQKSLNYYCARYYSLYLVYT